MKQLFSLPLTPDELYWAGFIQADGSISRAKMRVTFAQKELFAVEEFLRFLGQTSKVSYTARQYGYGWSEGYSASSMRGVIGLLELGIKSEPDSALYASRHFWRGLIDGDGTVFLNSCGLAPQVVLCSERESIIQAFSDWVGSLFDARGPAVYCKRGTKCWYSHVHAGKARALAVYLYKGSYSAVPRKRDLALSMEALDLRSKTGLLSVE